MTELHAASQHAEALLALARASVKTTCSGSVARLQRDLGLGHGIASALIDCLEEEGVLLAAYGPRERTLHPRFLKEHVRDVSGSPRTLYVRRIVALALYFFECHEENNAGDSRVTDLLSPFPLSTNEARALLLTRCFGAGMSLEQAALATHEFLVAQGRCTMDDPGIAEAIVSACLQHARAPSSDWTLDQRIDRAHLRLARYYRHMLSDGLSRHSRVPDYFVAKDHVPRGTSLMRDTHVGRNEIHGEHVVPCATLRDTALRYFDEGRSLDDVARMTRRCLAIVEITKTERKDLDFGLPPLLDVMTPDWDEVNDCIYARLHAKQIAFTPAVGAPCTCDGNPTHLENVVVKSAI